VIFLNERHLKRLMNEYIRYYRDDSPCIRYTTETALLAGQIDGKQTAKGIIIPFVNLLIGATALSLDSSILPVNIPHFQQIPGLNVISI
jgi:predicted nucleic acid-binding protein